MRSSMQYEDPSDDGTCDKKKLVLKLRLWRKNKESKNINYIKGGLEEMVLYFCIFWHLRFINWFG
jgi:hypothetical protein